KYRHSYQPRQVHKTLLAPLQHTAHCLLDCEQFIHLYAIADDLHGLRVFMPDQLIHTASGHQSPLDDDPHAVANHLHVGDDMGTEEHRLALIAETQDQVPDLLASDRVQP